MVLCPRRPQRRTRTCKNFVEPIAQLARHLCLDIPGVEGYCLFDRFQMYGVVVVTFSRPDRSRIG